VWQIALLNLDVYQWLSGTGYYLRQSEKHLMRKETDIFPLKIFSPSGKNFMSFFLPRCAHAK
jgi:hypothetical protein